MSRCDKPATQGRVGVSDRHPAEDAKIESGERVLVRYGRFAGRVGKVEDVFRREDAGRRYVLVWVRFGDRSVECFDPKNLIKKGGEG